MHPIERRTVAFNSRGVPCHGWLYLPVPQNAAPALPAVALAHGYGCLKAHDLPALAAQLAAAGIAALAFDYRTWGESGGLPRQQIFWHDQHEDYRAALTWLSLQPEIDAQRLGVWGTSYSGGHALYLAAFDRRIKAVVAQTPRASAFDAGFGGDGAAIARRDAFISQNRRQHYQTGEVAYMPLVSSDNGTAVLRGRAAYEWFMETMRDTDQLPWDNCVTLDSLDAGRDYAPGAPIHLIAPTPLLMVIATHDTLCPLTETVAAFARAGLPKQALLLPCGHFDIYRQPWQEQASAAAVGWFSQHLAP